MKAPFLILVFFLLGFSVYIGSISNGFVWDDEGQVVANKIIQSLSNAPQFFLGSTFDPGGSGKLLGIYYKPLMTFSFAGLYALFALDPFYFHIFQLILHVNNAILVFFLFRNFFKKTTALLLAVVFLIHPIQVEAVAYISALQDVLFFFFGIIALTIARTKEKSWSLISILLLFSLLAKEAGILFVIIIGIYYFAYRKKHLLGYSISSAVTLLVYAFLRFGIAQVAFQTVDYLPISRASLLERIFTMPKILLYYLQSFFFPKNLAIAQHWVIKIPSWQDFTFPLLTVMTFFAAVAFFWFRIRHDHTRVRIFLFFFVWYATGTVLHLQLFPLSMTVADRWFYFPMVGMLGMIGVTVQSLYTSTRLHGFRGKEASSQFSIVGLLGIFGLAAEKIIFLANQAFWQRTDTKLVFTAVVGVFLSLLVFRTQDRALDWHDNYTLFTHDIEISKNSFDLENGLGVELFRLGRINEAKLHFEKSANLVALPVNLTNLGIVYEKEGDLKKAKNYFEQALAIHGGSYVTYEALSQLILTYEGPIAAVSFTQEALKIYPYNSGLWMTLAMAKYQLGSDSEAASAAAYSVRLMKTYDYKQLLSQLQLKE